MGEPETGRRGRLALDRMGYNQPASMQLYPKFPWKVFNAKFLAVVYETDLDPVLDVLPPELEPASDPPQVVFMFNPGYEFGTGGGPYCECAPLIPVLYEGEPHLFPLVVYLGEGTEEWFAAGREVLADGKKIGHIEFRQELGRGQMLGILERPRGHRLATVVMGPMEEQGEESEFDLLPVISLRIHPGASGERPQIAELLRKEVETTFRRASDGSPWIFKGPATLVLGESEQDPLYKLPVRRIVQGYYVHFGTILEHAGVVVKDYLKD